jgi:propionyl-CoA carboxylase alpha chain
VHTVTPSRVSFEHDGLVMHATVHMVGELHFVQTHHGAATLTQLPRYPGEPATLRPGVLAAPMPGTVGRVEVVVGQRVQADEVLLTIEAMKLEHPIPAGHSGIVQAVPVAPGDQIEAGTVLAIVTPDPASPEQDRS